MRGAATEFYTHLYSAEACDPYCRNEPVRELPKLTLGQRCMLYAGLELQEMATIV